MTGVWVLMKDEDYQGFEVQGVFIEEEAARRALEALRDKELTEWEARFDREEAQNQARYKRGEISANTFNERGTRAKDDLAHRIASYGITEGVDAQKRRYIGYKGHYEARLVRFDAE